jgi:hypothetical protein
MNHGFIVCDECGDQTPRRGPFQKYCVRCSRKRAASRTRKASKQIGPRSQRQQSYDRKRSSLVEAGKRISAAHTKTKVLWDASEAPALLWLARVTVPFQYAASKNHIYALSGWHVALRRESRAIKDAIVLQLRAALRHHKVVQNKVWIDLLIEKPDHKGDAINVVDLVCDAIKEAIDVDDRWFSIRRLDWRIKKDQPQLIIGVGQDTDEHAQVCSYCGRALPFDFFYKAKGRKFGIGRECRECLQLARRIAKGAPA